MDDVLRDGMEDTTSNLPRGASTWIQCYGNAANMVGGRSRMKDGGRMKPGNATSCPKGLRKSQELDIFLLHFLNSSKLLHTLVIKCSESTDIPACNSGLGFSM